MHTATIPLQVPGPLSALVNLAATLPGIGSFVCHYMVILEFRQWLESSTAVDSIRSDAVDGNPRDDEGTCTLVLFDFEPVDKDLSPLEVMRMLLGGVCF